VAITTPEQLALAKRVRTQLIEHPGQHDQATFYGENLCGTTACTAGWTAVLNGASPVIRGHPSAGLWATYVITPSGGRKRIWTYAQDALGLTDEEAADLFDADTSESTVVDHLGQLIGDAEASLSAATR